MTGSSGGGDFAVAWQTTTPRTYQVARLLGRAHCRWTRQQSAVQDTANTRVNTPVRMAARQAAHKAATYVKHTSSRPGLQTVLAVANTVGCRVKPDIQLPRSPPLGGHHATHIPFSDACCLLQLCHDQFLPVSTRCVVRSQQRCMGSISRLVATHRCGEGTTSKHDSSCATSSLPAQRTNSSGVVGSAISVICGAEQQEVSTCSFQETRKASGATHLLIHPSVTWSGWRRRRVTGDRGIELRHTVRRGTRLVNSLPPAKGKQWA